MTASDRFDHLRAGALDMLDAGNSMASVSRMLAVPVTGIARWRGEPALQKPRPQPQATTVAQQQVDGRRLRPVITLTSDAIVVPTLLGRTTMPYAELADWSLVTHEKVMKYNGREFPIAGCLLTLSSRRAGQRPIELFMHAHIALGDAVTRRQSLVKQANTGLQPPRPKGRNQR